jgi:hypothetical protein
MIVLKKGELMANKKLKEEEVNIPEEVVWDILEFANEMGGFGQFQPAMNPLLLNQRMKDISLNPLQASETTLNNSMRDPKNSEAALQGFSQDFELQSQVYKKLLSYLGNMLSFDLSFSCKNAKSTDYKSPAYNKDLDIVKEFFDKFDYKREFPIVVKEMLRNEAYFCAIRDDIPDGIVLQELPSSPVYTMITGRFSHGLLFDMNLFWYNLAGVDIDLYPDFFKEKWGEFLTSGGKSYDPALPTSMRGMSGFTYWQSVPPEVGWVWKFNPEIATRIPYFAPLFLDLIQQPLIRALQKNISMSAATRLVLGEIGVLKDSGAKLKDQFNINPDLLGKFLSLIKSAIGESIKVAAAPITGLQSVEFSPQNELYDSYLKTVLASSGVNTSLIYTSHNVRPNVLESSLSLNVDEQMLYSLYPQFESFLNFQVNRLTKKFKFNFEFEGSQFFNNREQRFQVQKDLMAQGVILPRRISAAIGMNPFSFQRQMEEAKAMGWVDQLTPIVPAFQQGADGSKDNGRPKKSSSELGDSGDQTRSDGANIGRGGKNLT